MLEKRELAFSQFRIEINDLKQILKVFSSPWGVMRILGVNFCYKVPTMPMIGEPA